ncbi:hypothetical protein GmHk_05G012868 [Glycine max]|nr:hypothetical protein GmHk_05G012868 [Glycine max]
MVKNRGLGRKALGRRQASDDDNDARSGEGLPHLPTDSDNRSDPPTIAEELNEEQHEAPIEDPFTDVEGFSGRPHDTSILRYYENHITLRTWNGEERPELKVSSHGRKMAKFRRLAPEIEGLVGTSRLSPLIKD